jgi:hypothetical protein
MGRRLPEGNRERGRVTTDRHDGKWEFMHWSGARRSRFGRDGECSQGSLEAESRGCAKLGFICAIATGVGHAGEIRVPSRRIAFPLQET